MPDLKSRLRSPTSWLLSGRGPQGSRDKLGRETGRLGALSGALGIQSGLEVGVGNDGGGGDGGCSDGNGNKNGNFQSAVQSYTSLKIKIYRSEVSVWL